MKISSLDKLGYIQIKNFFNQEDINLLKKIHRYQTKIVYISKIQSVIKKFIRFITKKNNLFIKSEKNFLLDLLKYKQNNLVIEIINHFAYHKEINEVLRKHYNKTPILHGISILYSPSKSSKKLIKSQLFHFDYGENNKLIKVFIPLDKIDKESGPLLYLNRQDSNKFKSHDEKRIEDKLVMPQYNSKIKKFIADVGDILFINTTQCLHCGSRYNSKARYVLLINFTKNKSIYSKESKQNLENILQN